MEYTNKNGINFNSYIKGNIWITDITVNNTKYSTEEYYSDMIFTYNNSYDYYPHLETLDFEGLCKLCGKDPFKFDWSKYPKDQTTEELLESLDKPYCTEEELKRNANTVIVLPNDLFKVEPIKDMTIIEKGKLTKGPKKSEPKVKTTIIEIPKSKPGRKPKK